MKNETYSIGQPVYVSSPLTESGDISTDGIIERHVSSGEMVRVLDLKTDKTMVLFFERSQIGAIPRFGSAFGAIAGW